MRRKCGAGAPARELSHELFGRCNPNHETASLRTCHPPNQIFLLAPAFRPNRKRVKHSERQRVADRIIHPPAQIALSQNLHPDDAFARRLHLPQNANNFLGRGVHVARRSG